MKGVGRVQLEQQILAYCGYRVLSLGVPGCCIDPMSQQKHVLEVIQARSVFFIVHWTVFFRKPWGVGKGRFSYIIRSLFVLTGAFFSLNHSFIVGLAHLSSLSFMFGVYFLSFRTIFSLRLTWGLISPYFFLC